MGVSPGKACEGPGKLPQAFLQPWETHWRSGPEQNLTSRSSLPSEAVWTLPMGKETSRRRPYSFLGTVVPREQLPALFLVQSTQQPPSDLVALLPLLIHH